MKKNTCKLKRYKTIYVILNIIELPIRLPCSLLLILGEIFKRLSEIILDYSNEITNKLLHLIVRTFKFDAIADKKYGVIPKVK
jgi:hypothetical protein